MHHKQVQGFTLVELIMVVAVMAILVSMAVPSFSKMMAQKRLSKAAESITSTLQFARSETISRNNSMFVDTNAGTSWCVGFVQEDSGAGITDCDCTIKDATANNACFVTTADAASTRLLRRADNDGDTDVNVAFAFTGGTTTRFISPRATALNGTVTLTSSTSGDVAKVVVSRMGRVKICSADLGGYPACP